MAIGRSLSPLSPRGYRNKKDRQPEKRAPSPERIPGMSAERRAELEQAIKDGEKQIATLKGIAEQAKIKAAATKEEWERAQETGEGNVEQLLEVAKDAAGKWDRADIDHMKAVTELRRIRASAPKFHPDLDLTQFGYQPRRLTIEIESCTNCHEHAYCTHHDEMKYWGYTLALMRQLEYTVCELFDAKEDWEKLDFVVNPGPRSRGMYCQPMPYSTVLWKAMVQNSSTLKFEESDSFRYPRIGSWDVWVHKGDRRIPAYSKLRSNAWPDIEDVVDNICGIIDEMGGYDVLPEIVKEKPEAKEVYTKTLTDEDIRAMLKKKFNTLSVGFKCWDKDKNGIIDQDEFRNGLKKVGISLPAAQFKQIWAMADADNSGSITYAEFCSKFAVYKASKNIARTGADSQFGGAFTRDGMGDVVFGDEDGVDVNELYKNQEKKRNTMTMMAETMSFVDLLPSQIGVKELRARILQTKGSFLNAMRHLDREPDSSLSYEEFCQFLPRVIDGDDFVCQPTVWHEHNVFKRLWKELDTDLSGSITLDELMRTNDIGHKETAHELKKLKGQAMDEEIVYHRGSVKSRIAQAEQLMLEKQAAQSTSPVGDDNENVEDETAAMEANDINTNEEISQEQKVTPADFTPAEESPENPPVEAAAAAAAEEAAPEGAAEPAPAPVEEPAPAEAAVEEL